MKAIILCNEKDEKINEKLPNCLLRLCGKTILEYAIDKVEKADFSEVTILSNYEPIIDLELNCHNIEIDVNFETLDNSFKYLSELNDKDDLLIIESNNLFDFDLKAMIRHHIINKNICTISSVEQDDFYNYTCFSTGNDKVITSIIENPSADNNSAKHIFSGVYIISKEILSDINFKESENFIFNFISSIISNDKKAVLYEETGYWNNISNHQRFLQCQNNILDGKVKNEPSANQKENKIFIKDNSTFCGVTIIPPVYIGSNVSIESGAVIFSGTVIDDNAYIQRGTTIENSYIGENTIIDSNCKINSSIIFENCVLNNDITIDEFSILEENVKIGCNAKIRPNTRISHNTEISLNSVINSNGTKNQNSNFYIDEDYECCFKNSQKMPYDISLLGMAIGSALNKSDIIVIGFEENKVSKAFANTLITSILSTGISVFNVSVCTLQQAIFSSLKLDCSVGCYISADISLKIKLFGKSGMPLSNDIERKIEKFYSKKSFRTQTFSNWGSCYNFSGANKLYENFLLDLLPSKFLSQNIRIKTSSLEIATIADKLFYEKNNIDGEKIIFHITDDGGRCTAYNEKTNFVTYEKLILLCIKIFSEKQIPVNIPNDFYNIAKDYCKSLNIKFADDKIINESHLFTTDALVIISTISKYLSQNNITFFEALKDVPDICIVERYISLNDNKKAIKKIDDIISNEYSNAMIKPLKSKTGLLLFAESSKAEFASSICDEIQEKIENIKNNISN